MTAGLFIPATAALALRLHEFAYMTKTSQVTTLHLCYFALQVYDSRPVHPCNSCARLQPPLQQQPALEPAGDCVLVASLAYTH
jgi:hypothetical protein